MGQPPLTSAEVKKLLSLFDESSPANWHVGEHPSQIVSDCDCCDLIATAAAFGVEDSPASYHSELIVTLRNFGPRMIEEIRELRKLQEKVQGMQDKIDYLTEQMERARNYKGIEGWACPLCTYENGIFIKHCEMHRQMKEMHDSNIP